MTNKNLKILIIDDEAKLRQMLVHVIEQGGFTTLEASDGEEGLKVALSEHPDLIVSDILMPKIDGMTVLKKLREDAWGKGVPVILLTNIEPNDKDLGRIVEDRASYYLIKANISMEDIVDKIQELLEPSR